MAPWTRLPPELSGLPSAIKLRPHLRRGGERAVRGLRRSVAVGLAGLPKAPDVGRAAFAARLGMMLAQRELDLVDVLVLDLRALAIGV